MQTVGDNPRNGTCPSLCSWRRVLQAHAGSSWVTYSESRIGDPGITATEFPYSSSNTLLLLLRIQRYMWWITTPHAGILRTIWGLQSKNFGETKRTPKNEHTSYLFISFWQSALAKYALELGLHTICEQTRCCVQWWLKKWFTELFHINSTPKAIN